MNKKLEVNDLKISFRTNNGRVQAVRSISFDLYENETLAIVGESGSGKSVTSRAIMGILAPNVIVEGGEILYDGKDLLQISEKDFHHLRGDKLAMVFQDPLSSLNPIVKIGKQLTEAMLLKNRFVRKESKRKLTRAFKILATHINWATKASENKEILKRNKKNIKIFKRFVHRYIVFQNAFNNALQHLEYALIELEELRLHVSKGITADFMIRRVQVHANLKEAINPFLIELRHPLLQKMDILMTMQEPFDASLISVLVDEMIEIIKKILSDLKPNFFGLGYYALYHKEIPLVSITELNKLTHEYLDENFMLSYIEDLKLGVRNSFETKNSLKKEAILKLKEVLNEINEKKEINLVLFKEVFDFTKQIDNPLRIGKESFNSTFKTSIQKQLQMYFNAKYTNERNKKKYDRSVSQMNRLKEKGKKVTDVSKPNYVDEEQIINNIKHIILKLIETYQNEILEYDSFDDLNYTISIIDYLKDLSGKTVYKVTKKSAKEKALRLMREVGIPDPKKRFNQYPFQFSGGMRQRIVIAIALSANPDILICDEPTTALDVTIQGQILELINELKRKRNLSIIFITHDLGVVANMADRIAVMYAGKIVEYGTTEEVFYDPKHPYTWALLSSMPDLETKEKLTSIPGTPPNMIYPPKGDAFAARNKYAMKIDFEREPPLFKISETHYAATWLLHPMAPKVEPPSIILKRAKQAKEGVH